MSAARTIPDHVRDVQIDAANPEISAFVSANAGSGKTYVLAQRVINLLLRGVDPAKILCITFTKTAAANMANEVFKRLAAWTALDDAALDEQIALSTGKTPSAEERARARRLFASALETPGGLKVQTIHAFCTRLLHQFPFEANVAARFTVLDEASTTQLLDRLTLQVLLEASAAPDKRARQGARNGHRGRRRHHLQGRHRRRHQGARRDRRLDHAGRRHRQGHRAIVAELRHCGGRQPRKGRGRILLGLAHSGKPNGRR